MSSSIIPLPINQSCRSWNKQLKFIAVLHAAVSGSFRLWINKISTRHKQFVLKLPDGTWLTVVGSWNRVGVRCYAHWQTSTSGRLIRTTDAVKGLSFVWAQNSVERASVFWFQLGILVHCLFNLSSGYYKIQLWSSEAKQATYILAKLSTRATIFA